MTKPTAVLGYTVTPSSTTKSEPAGSSRVARGIVVVLLIALLLPLLHYFDDSAAPMDEGSLLVYPEQILKGKLPYRDFETFYGPANVYLLSGAYALFGPSVGVERTVGLVYRFAILSAIFVAARRWSTMLAVACVWVAALVSLNTGVAAYAWMNAIACALWSLVLLSGETSRARCLLGGVLAGSALLFRPDLGPAVILSTLPVWLRLNSNSNITCVGGAAVALLPLLAIAIAASPRSVIDNLLIYPVFRGNGARHMPLGSASRPLLWVVAGHCLAVITALLAAIVSYQKRDAKCATLLLLAIFAAGITHQALQRCDELHALFTVFLSFGILPLAAFTLLSRATCRQARATRQWAAVALAALFLATFSPRLIKFSGTQFLCAINPHLTPQFEPASYFLEMNPGSANRPGSRLAADVASADWLVLDETYDNWREPNASSRFGSDEPNAVVRAQFALSYRFGSFLVYQRKPKSESVVAQF